MLLVNTPMLSKILEDNQQYVPALSAVAASMLAFMALRTWSAKSAEQQAFEAIPIPNGCFPYIGHTPSFTKLPSLVFNDWRQQVGPIFRVRMGVQTWVVLSDPVMLHELLSSKGAQTSGRIKTRFSHDYYSLGGKGIVFAPSGKSWKNNRTAVLSVLAPNVLSKFSHIRQKEADELIQNLIQKTKEQGSVNPRVPVLRAGLNFILATCFATRCPSDDDPLFKRMVADGDDGFELAGIHNDLGTFFPILSIIDFVLRRERKFRKFIETRRNPMSRMLIQDAVKSDQDSLFKRLYAMKEEYGMDDDDLLVISTDLLGGGSDTISGTLSWMFAVLLHHQDVQEKLCIEVDTFIKEHNRLPEFTDREAMPYLIAVQKECMRYRPVTHLALHSAEEDVTFRQYFIPKGTAIIGNTFAMHHDSKLYENPDKFIPERFLKNTNTMLACANGKVENRDHFVFGWGRRICPGIHLAEVEQFEICVRLFAKCKIEPCFDAQGKPILPDLDDMRDGGLVVNIGPYTARFVSRNDNVLHLIR